MVDGQSCFPSLLWHPVDVGSDALQTATRSWTVMGRRAQLLGLLAATTVFMVVGGCWLTAPAPGVTRTNFERLHTRMTLEEVERFLGRPADDKRYITFGSTYIWRGEEGTVEIYRWSEPGLEGRFLVELSDEENQLVEC